MKNTIIFILTSLLIASIFTINSIKREPNIYRDYLQGIVKSTGTEQYKITCKESEDPYFFTYNSVGSTSPVISEYDKNIIQIGVNCVDRITQEDKSGRSIIFQGSLLKKTLYSDEKVSYNYLRINYRQ